MTVDELLGELTDLYINWALSEERHALVPPRWQQIVRELQRRRRNGHASSCTCEDCCQLWAPADGL
jgi:hypothetical protein